MDKAKLPQKLTESGLMMALATILSIFKMAELPYGGSITFASMLPMIIIAYRYGFKWGLFSGVTFGLVQMLLGLKNVSYATSAVAAVAIILLDYIFAFAATSLGGLFNKSEKPAVAMGRAALLVCGVRFIFHVISGCTVWAGLSIPTGDALLYSIVYNCTYMIPETIITVIAAVYLASVLEFRKPRLTAAKRSGSKSGLILFAVSGLIAVVALAAIVAIVFMQLQNPESGEFDVTGIQNVNFAVVGAIAGASALAIIILTAIRSRLKKREAES